MDEIRADMKGDWNRRALENARLYIATNNWESEEIFERSGESDARLFFEGEENKLLTEDAVLVNIGCGIGRMDRYLAPKVGRLIGTDVSGEMVALASKRLNDLKNVEFVEGDGWTLKPLQDDLADIVISCNTFQHVLPQVAASYFKDVFRVLKPGGSFLFHVPEDPGNHPLDLPDDDTVGMRFYKEEDLMRQLTGIGYEWISCRRHRVEASGLTIDQIRPWVRKPAGSG